MTNDSGKIAFLLAVMLVLVGLIAPIVIEKIKFDNAASRWEEAKARHDRNDMNAAWRDECDLYKGRFGKFPYENECVPGKEPF